jgi:hypothetical protein
MKCHLYSTLPPYCSFRLVIPYPHLEISLGNEARADISRSCTSANPTITNYHTRSSAVERMIRAGNHHMGGGGFLPSSVPSLNSDNLASCLMGKLRADQSR